MLRLFSIVATTMIPIMTNAQTCMERHNLLAALVDDYQEQVVGVGLSDDGLYIVEVAANEQTGTFTIFSTNAAGISCLVVSGQGYEDTTFKRGVKG